LRNTRGGNLRNIGDGSHEKDTSCDFRPFRLFSSRITSQRFIPPHGGFPDRNLGFML
jgi:hypothetical protein